MMRPLRALRAACLAPGLALALCASDAAAADLIGPFGALQVAAADSGETVVFWGTRAAFGTPGGTFSAPLTISAPGPAGLPAIAMDGAGDVVAVWEAVNSRDCDKYGCIYDSIGVFATTRPAGGSFGPPVRLSPPQPSVVANPELVMNRAGDWVVGLTVGTVRVVGAGRGATLPSGFSALAVPGFAASSAVTMAGMDEAGNTTLTGRDAAGRPTTAVRKLDGSITEFTVLDDAMVPGSHLRVGVGPGGHAVAVWPAAGFLRWATRMPGGSFAAPVSSGVAAAYPPERIGVDGQGRTIMVLHPQPVFPARFTMQARRGSVAAPFGDAVTLSGADRDVGGPGRFAMGPGGDAVLAWFDTQGYSNRVSKAAIATDAGPFSQPLTVPTDDRLSNGAELPAVAIDGAGRAVLAWTATTGNVQQILVAALTPTAVAGPSVVARGPLTVAPTPRGRAFAAKRQVLRIGSDGTVRPTLTCVANLGSCSGTLRIDVRPAPGRRRIRLGTHRFVFSNGRSQPVVVRVTRDARRAAARRSLKGTITVRTNVYGASTVAFTDVVNATVRRTRR